MNLNDKIPVEFDLRPAYYDDFQCLAGDCRFSCCKGWHISFDKKEYMELKRQRGTQELNTRMDHALHRLRSGPLSGIHYGEFRMKEDGDCPLHCENGLCRLQLEKGPKALPTVCQVFPRQEQPYLSGYLERSLSPACEAVLELLWNLPDGVDFRADPLPTPTNIELPREYRDTLVYGFQDVRSRCIDLLQDRRLPLPQRIMLMGLTLKKLVDGEKDLQRWMKQTDLLSEEAARDGVPLGEGNEQSLPSYLVNCIRIMYTLGGSNDDLAAVCKDLLDVLDFEQDTGNRGSISIEPYLAARKRFDERFAGREYFMENLMVSLFFQLKIPALDSMEKLWRGYVAFCNLYGFLRYLAVMSCREGAPGDKDELFRMLVFGSRGLIHNNTNHAALLDSLYQHDSTTLAHMAILLGN